MVDKIKKTGRDTGHFLYVAYELLWLAATIAGATKLATLPHVGTAQGKLPVWQFVAALLFATVAWKIALLHKKAA